jgi:hypothetical protein
MQIINLIMFNDDLRITYAREDHQLVITVAYSGQVEQHPISIDTVMKESHSIEVLVMNKLAESAILRKLSVSQATPNLPG